MIQKPFLAAIVSLIGDFTLNVVQYSNILDDWAGIIKQDVEFA